MRSRSTCKICRMQMVEFREDIKAHQCTNCGFINLPTDRRKVSSNLLGTGEGFIDALSAFRLNISLGQFRREIKNQSHIKKPNILEVGSGTGYLVYKLAKEGYHITAIEPDKHKFASLSRKSSGFNNVTLIPKSLEDSQLPSGFFDICYSIHVIEHFDEPQAAMKKLANAMSKHGLLFLITPNGDSRGLNIFKENWWYLGDLTHHQLFTPKSIEVLLEAADFEILKIKRTAILESLTVEAMSILRWLNLDSKDFPLKTLALPFISSLMSLFLNPLRWLNPSKMCPDMEIWARRR